MASIEELRQQRFQLLKHIYDITDGSRFKHVSMWDMGKEVDLSRDQTKGVCEYLVGEGLLEHVALGGSIAITHEGVVEIENALSNPESSTHYFPAVNIINIGSMQQSQIQQGTVSSSQALQYSFDPQMIEVFLSQLNDLLPKLSLSKDSRLEADAEISTINAQLSSPYPKQNIVKESLQSLRTILHSAASSVLAQNLLAQLSAMGL